MRWYPKLPKIVTDGTEVLDMSYADLMQSCEKKFKNDVKAYELERKIRGVPIDFRSKLIKGKLDRPGVEKVYDIISILSFRFRITSEDIYLLEPLVYRVAAVVRRIDACFSVCSDMMRKSDWYIIPTMLEHRVKIFSFQDLVEVIMPVTYQHLMAIKALNDEFLNHIFVGLFFSLMPKQHAYRILDSFLIEGGKILYRYGVALIAMFKRLIKSDHFRTGEQFWTHVSTVCHSESFNFEDLHAEAFDKNKKFFFRIISRTSKINRRNINALKNQIREPLEKSLLLTKGSAGTFKLASDVSAMAAVSTWFDRGLWSQSRILDTTMAIKLQLYLAEAMHPFSRHAVQQAQQRPQQAVGATSGSLAGIGRLPRSATPENVVADPAAADPGVDSVSCNEASYDSGAEASSPSTAVEDMQLVFSTAVHGRSLAALYAQVAGRCPCVLILRTLNKKAVIGVYVSCAIAPSHRSGIYDQRGDSSCFCFRLNSLVLNTGGTQTSINTVSSFKSAYARKYPAKPPTSLMSTVNAEGEAAMAMGDDPEAATEDPVEAGAGTGAGTGASRRAEGKRRQRRAAHPLHVRPEPFDETKETYTIGRYVDFVKTRYINGDASVLMFGATASRQPMNAIRL